MNILDKIHESKSRSDGVLALGMFAIGVGVGIHVSKWFSEENEVVFVTRIEDEHEEPMLPFGMTIEVPEIKYEKIPLEDEEPIPATMPRVIVEAPEEFNLIAATKAEDPNEWSYEREKINRIGKEPYALHADEFHANEEDRDQLTLTYYAVDDIMVDPLGVPVYNYRDITGPLRFGYGSDGEEDYYYVRNPGMNTEYEIIREHDSYASAVLGIVDGA